MPISSAAGKPLPETSPSTSPTPAPAQGIQYGILKREVDTNRQLYEALLQRYKELEASGAGQNNIKLIDLAEVPDEPYAPSLIQNLLVALVGGLVWTMVNIVFSTLSQLNR